MLRVLDMPELTESEQVEVMACLVNPALIKYFTYQAREHIQDLLKYDTSSTTPENYAIKASFARGQIDVFEGLVEMAIPPEAPSTQGEQ